MQCSNPVTIKYKDGLRREVPCGSCILCRIARSREWAIRCLHELYSNGGLGAFTTLTYDPEHLPDNASLRRDDVVLWIKRLRKAAHPQKIKVFLCGEYGEKTFRPHYHAIIYGLPQCTCSVRPDQPCQCGGRSLAVKTWGKGGIDKFGSVTYESCRYTADYISKAQTQKDTYIDREPPFLIISKGMGRKYAEEYAEELLKEKALPIKG